MTFDLFPESALNLCQPGMPQLLTWVSVPFAVDVMRLVGSALGFTGAEDSSFSLRLLTCKQQFSLLCVALG